MTRKESGGAASDGPASNNDRSGGAVKTITKVKERSQEAASRMEKFARVPGKDLLQAGEAGVIPGPSQDQSFLLQKEDNARCKRSQRLW